MHFVCRQGTLALVILSLWTWCTRQGLSIVKVCFCSDDWKLLWSFRDPFYAHHPSFETIKAMKPGQKVGLTTCHYVCPMSDLLCMSHCLSHHACRVCESSCITWLLCTALTVDPYCSGISTPNQVSKRCLKSCKLKTPGVLCTCICWQNGQNPDWVHIPTSVVLPAFFSTVSNPGPNTSEIKAINARIHASFCRTGTVEFHYHLLLDISCV